jgi:hypothetical protein
MEGYERKMREHGKEIEVVWLEGGHQSAGPQVQIFCFEKMLEFAEGVLARRR